MPGRNRDEVKAVSVRPTAERRGALPAPAGVTAGNGLSTLGVDLSWDAVEGAASYEVWRHTTDDPATATRLARSVATTTYRDVWAVPELLYSYWVRARNAVATSGFSAPGTGWRRLPRPTDAARQLPSARE